MALGEHHGSRLPRDLSGREIFVLTPIAIMCVVIGLKPGVLLAPIDQPIAQLEASIQQRNEAHRAMTVADDRELNAEGPREPIIVTASAHHHNDREEGKTH